MFQRTHASWRAILERGDVSRTLMSCQIKDYHGAPLTLTAALFHFMPLHQLFTKPAKEMERVPGESWRREGRTGG